MFKLDFSVKGPPLKINLHDRLVLLGSCFSESIGSILKENKFQALVNPFGTVYNPVSILRLIDLALEESSEIRAVQHGAIWYDWDAHSQTSALLKEDLTTDTMGLRTELKKWLEKAKWLIITPGTSFAY